MQTPTAFHRKSHLVLARLAIIVMVQGSGIMAENPLERWRPLLTLPQSGLVEITAGKGADSREFVVVAEGTGKLISWPQNSPAQQSVSSVPNRLRSVTYGNGRFVAVGLDEPIVTSTNALDWETVSVSGSGLTKVVFGNDIFVAVRQNGLMRSTDGIVWTTPVRPAPWSFPTLYFVRDIFVLAGDRGTNFLSKDGLTWTGVSSGTTENLYTLGYGNGIFMAVDFKHQLLTSPDALAWTVRGKLEVGRSRPGRIAVGNGYIVIVGDNARAYSRNGLSWTIVPSAVSEGSVIFANGEFLAAGYEHVHASDQIIDLEINGAGTLAITGVANRMYQIDTANQLLPANTQWSARHAFLMSEAPYRWQDSQPAEGASRFYRVMAIPDAR